MTGAPTLVGVGASAGGLEAFTQMLPACGDAGTWRSCSSSTCRRITRARWRRC